MAEFQTPQGWFVGLVVPKKPAAAKPPVTVSPPPPREVKPKQGKKK